MQALLPEVVHLRHAGCGASASIEGEQRTRAGQDLVGPVLIAQLRRIALARLLRSVSGDRRSRSTDKLDRDRLAIEQVVPWACVRVGTDRS